MSGLTQSQIDQLLQENANPAVAEEPEGLTSIEQDALGEAINISMGAAATAISTMLNMKVLITTPSLSVTRTEAFQCKALEPAVGVAISYITGLVGNNILMIKQSDVKVIVDLLLGGDGTNTDGEFTEMHSSAISEVMNQMMGSSSTAMASFFDRPINISTPTVYALKKEEDSKELVTQEVSESIICIRFNLYIGDLINSELLSIMSLPFGKELADIMLNFGAPKEEIKQEQPPKAVIAPPKEYNHSSGNKQSTYKSPMVSSVQVSPISYNNFDNDVMVNSPLIPENMNLIMDVPLTVTVQIGKTQKPVREILEFAQGSIIELEKQAGDPAEIIVNGQLLARGDIVVIDDNFGIRITEILPPAEKQFLV